MRFRRAIIATVCLVTLAGGGGLLGSALTRPGASSTDSSGGAVGSPLAGHPAPELSGRTLDGGHYRLRPGGAKVTLVNVWASWCGPCRNELPLLAATAQRWKPRGVRVVTVNTKDGPVAARSLLKEVDATGLLTVLDPYGDLAVSWGATGIPETFVVDQDGKVRARWTGPLTKDWLDTQLARWGSA
ncbi:TlpA family protein disulfide reductase [Actinopolymorpha singaporensis]|uniref:Cytochrome c biogenesis protein CcmG, thiol:disulfide interchange protein DsbE n=1 Tax=Actinopolymorpha singaporensis TaxID=117157 RepID=A0A1H1TMA0_9ACTN|nr:redoxin family protein [Actinopolymorpha singaporensis]SDS60709.1 cytochrome c biogenesis protein CcmG, thiol:disulfide interchange protein DsbE [Actinopolymorpha singaporensis]